MTLGNLLDGIGNAIKTIEAADNGITAITKLVESAQSTARQALQDGGAGSGTIVESSSSISTNGLTPIAGESIQDQAKRQTLSNLGFAAGDTITVQTTDTSTGTFSMSSTPPALPRPKSPTAGKLKLTGSDAETVNLSIVDTGGDASTATTQATSLAASLGFGTNSNVDLSSPADGDYVDAGETAVTFTDGATAGAADSLSITTQANPASNSSTRQKLIRKDYTKAAINTLQTGADNLVLADTNEEGANLLALQTRQQLSTTALSLSSQADQASLSARANDLANLLDGIGNAIKTIEAADNGITAITKLDQAKRQTLSNLGFAAGDTITVQTTDTSTGSVSNISITVGTTQKTDGTGPVSTVQDVLDVVNASGVATAEVTDAGKLKLTGSDAETATSLAASLGFGTNSNIDLSSPADGDYVDAGETAVAFTDESWCRSSTTFLGQIDKLAADASFNGINLINSSSSKLTVAFNEKRDAATKSELKIQGEDLTSSGLSITKATSLNDTEANTALDELSTALITLREAGSKFGSNLSMVQIRKDFTKATINTLQTGADNLVLADTNEEGANLLALQTRQQLSTTALSLSSQADQAVLSLF
eukprot:jgi/Tetstr1/441453/TSEL_029698.t1